MGMNTKDLEDKCFFKIEIEPLNHIKPIDGQKYGNLNIVPKTRPESIAKHYLAVLDANDKTFLGIKRYHNRYRNNLEKAVRTNKQVDNEARLFLTKYAYTINPLFISIGINSERNEFMSSYFGIKLGELFAKLSEHEELWNNADEEKTIQTKFLEVKGNKAEFNIFLEEQFLDKRIYVSSSNRYDLGNFPYLSIGIVDDGTYNKETYKFIHLLTCRLSSSNDWMPGYAPFKSTIISYIKKMFILSQIPVRDSLFIPLTFYVKNIQMNKSMLENESKIFLEARELKIKAEIYLKNNVNASYYDLHSFLTERKIISKTFWDENSFSKIEKIFSKDSIFEKDQEKILELALMAKEKREVKEKGAGERFNEIKSLF